MVSIRDKIDMGKRLTPGVRVINVKMVNEGVAQKVRSTQARVVWRMGFGSAGDVAPDQVPGDYPLQHSFAPSKISKILASR
jgi:hypothetical protein